MNLCKTVGVFGVENYDLGAKSKHFQTYFTKIIWCLLKVSRSQNKIVEQKLLPKNEPNALRIDTKLSYNCPFDSKNEHQ